MRHAVRRFAATAGRVSLPILRLPTTIFPAQCCSLPVTAASFERMVPGGITPELADEIARDGGKLALVAYGHQVGVMVDIGAPTSGYDRELFQQPQGWDVGMAVHCVGADRLSLLETGQRTPAGGRMAHFEYVVDEDEPSVTRQLEDEATVARSLLDLAAERQAFDLCLCTLDEELGMDVELALSHPYFLRLALRPEDDPVALSFWCAARLPLTTALRHHMLSCTDPLKRLRDVVDAMRLLLEPSMEGRAAARKFKIVYDTAEASGCELEPPRAVVDWAAANDPAVTRW